jgi:hypothetical protein
VVLDLVEVGLDIICVDDDVITPLADAEVVCPDQDVLLGVAKITVELRSIGC